MSNAIIDGDSLIFAMFHPNKVLDSNGKPKRTEDDSKFIYKEKSLSEIISSCHYLMNDILTKSKSDNYILFIKGKNTTKSKEAINPEYKADREKLISPKFWTFTKEYLKLTFGAIEVNEIEVDDAVNITRLSIKDSFICAIDSDLLGLTGTHYNWRKDEWITKTREEEECKFWTDMITGTHNNCKGIPGKGEVYAKKVFFNEISIDGCLASESYNLLTYNAYINSFGEYRGLQEFNKNYFCNKILENYEHFSIPNLIKFNNKKDEEW